MEIVDVTSDGRSGVTGCPGRNSALPQLAQKRLSSGFSCPHRVQKMVGISRASSVGTVRLRLMVLATYAALTVRSTSNPGQLMPAS
jgi:hypothetical protein